MSASVAHIFGSEAKVKIMRLFIFNPMLTFAPAEVSHRAKVGQAPVRRELSNLLKAGLIRKRGKVYGLNRDYRYLAALGHFLIDANPLSEREIIRRISSAGIIKLILTSGVFLRNPDAPVDILIVGDHIKQGKLTTVMSAIEAELGKELRYAVFDTSDFKYRLGIYDKLVRDIMDSQHEKILNKLGLEVMKKASAVIHSA